MVWRWRRRLGGSLCKEERCGKRLTRGYAVWASRCRGNGFSYWYVSSALECLHGDFLIKTGVGGLTLGGGHGWLSGQYGLTIDNLLGCEIVLSSGQILDVDSQSHPDLFWALKGAGKNFGVVTSFIFQGHPQEEMVFIGDITYSADALLDLISAFEGLVPKLPANSGAFLEFWVVEEGIDIRVELFFNGSEAEGRKLFAPILNIGNATSKVCGMAPYPHLNEQSNHLFPHGLRQMNTVICISPFKSENTKQHQRGHLLSP